MVDKEKVTKGLTGCVTASLGKACPVDFPYFPQCFPDVGPTNPFMPLMQDALSLLKDHDAVKPIKKDTVEITARYGYECPCGAPLLIGQPYCANCGRQVKWE